MTYLVLCMRRDVNPSGPTGWFGWLEDRCSLFPVTGSGDPFFVFLVAVDNLCVICCEPSHEIRVMMCQNLCLEYIQATLEGLGSGIRFLFVLPCPRFLWVGCVNGVRAGLHVGRCT